MARKIGRDPARKIEIAVSDERERNRNGLHFGLHSDEATALPQLEIRYKAVRKTSPWRDIGKELAERESIEPMLASCEAEACELGENKNVVSIAWPPLRCKLRG